MSAQQRRPPLALVPPDAPETPQATPETPKIARGPLGVMGWLEKRSQPYIVLATAIAAVIRGFYLFTDKLVNLARVPALNIPLSIITGIIMSVVSELTISIAGRRHKLYKAQLYNAMLAAASANKQQKPMWDVEVARLTDQVSANLWAMRISMGMSLVAAASYLIDSTGAAGVVPFLLASALAGYVLYMMYYHGVQTDIIKEDGTQETAESILDTLNVIRVEAIAKLRSELAQSSAMSPAARLALIATGLPITEQRRVMPTVRLLLGADQRSEDPDEGLAGWYTMRDIVMMLEPHTPAARMDNAARKYRRKCSDNAHKFPKEIRLSAERGWLIDPDFAASFFSLPADIAIPGAERIVDGTLVYHNGDEDDSAE